MSQAVAGTAGTDQFGNPIDGTVGYARGQILGSSADEIARTIYARAIVRERVSTMGEESVFDLSGLPRGFPLDPEDLPKLRSQLMYYGYFTGTAEDLAIRFMGGDPAIHAAVFLNRVSAGMLAMAVALLQRGDTVVSVVPKGRSHPSVQRAVELVGGRFVDVVGMDAFESAVQELRPRMVVATPITSAKHHLPVPDLVRFAEVARKSGAISFVDDAHMASRIAFFDDPLPFQCAPLDLAILSTDKHIIGPRAGVVVGNREMVQQIRSRAMEFGLEAQSGQYVAARRALERHRTEPIKQAGELAREVLGRMEQKYGKGRFYLGGPGVALSGDEALAIVLELTGRSSSPLVPVEAAAVVCNRMLKEHGVLTVVPVSMPGSAPVVRVMMFPDGVKLGADRIIAALEDGLATLRDLLVRPDAAREVILGEAS